MKTHQLATFFDKLNSLGDSWATPVRTALTELTTALQELPDQTIKEFVKSARKVATPDKATKGKEALDLNALVAQIRAVRESSPNNESVINLDSLNLNNNHLKDILKAFGEKPTNTVVANMAKVRQLLRPGVGATVTTVEPPATVPDTQAIEEGLRLYEALLEDRKLSIADVRAGFEPLKAYPKPIIEEISRRAGYTPAGSQATILERLLNNLEGIKMNQHRSDRILAPTGT